MALIKSMRLRTLPLSLSGVVLGSMLAASCHDVNAWTILFLVLTAVSLQVLSNLSNELGDTLSGTDGDGRQGVIYSIQSGEMSINEMKRAIGVTVLVCCIFGLLMIRSAFGTFFSISAILFIALGAAAILAAIKYTLGRKPYGYIGLGDISVFIFFGLATVLGSYYIVAGEMPTLSYLLPAVSTGCFCVGVLNVNNIRDIKTDAKTRKTVAISLGARKAKIYQTILIACGWISMTAFCLSFAFNIRHFLFVLTLPLFIFHLVGVWHKTDRELDPMLPLLVMSTFAFNLLVGLGFIIILS